MDKPFLVVISGALCGTFKTLEEAQESLKAQLIARKKRTSGIIYQAVETIEPVTFVTEWKIGQVTASEPKPEPGYQPEGFDTQKTLVEYAREGGPVPHAPAGFGSDFGTEF